MGYNFISDFMEFGSGTECPKAFIRWASLYPISCAAGRRYFTDVGIFRYYPELCFILVGQSGAKKSVGKNFAKEILTEALPDYPVAADITSRDGLINWLASENTLRTYINYEGAEVEWHPLALFVDEMVHFTSYSVHDMIDFLVAIYGQKYFKSITIKRKVEELIEPCVNLIGCTTPDWITKNLKTGALKGGWSRRFHVVYEPKIADDVIPWPQGIKGRDVYRERLKNHLRKITQGAGEFHWTPEAREVFDKWYRENRKNLPDDEHLRPYFLTKDLHVAKCAMMVALAEEDFQLIITKEIIEVVLALFASNERHLGSLYMAGGRNELAVPQQKLLDLITDLGGGCEKKELLRRMGKDFSPMEQIATIRYLQDSGQISLATPVKFPEGTKEMIMIPWKFNEVKNNGGKWI